MSTRGEASGDTAFGTLAKLIGGLIIMVLISTESAHAQGTRKHSSTSGDTLVIYHSRSGATKTMAQEITVWFGVRMAPIEAEEYTEDFAGWRKAYDHAWNKKPAVIKPEGADLSRYKLLFLGSPIWWYSPSPPLWTFVKNSDLTGCKVVLFNTFNSSFDQKEIDRFGKLVEQRGGRLIDHIWVRRGRIYWQKSEKELIEESNRILSEKAADWLE